MNKNLLQRDLEGKKILLEKVRAHIIETAVGVMELEVFLNLKNHLKTIIILWALIILGLVA